MRNIQNGYEGIMGTNGAREEVKNGGFSNSRQLMLKMQANALLNSENGVEDKTPLKIAKHGHHLKGDEISLYLQKYKIDDPRNLKFAGANNRRSERLNLFDPNQKFSDPDFGY